MMAAGIPDLAEELGGDADIPGDLMLGYALGDQGIFFKELQIAFLGRLGDGSIEALLQDT